MGKIAFVFSGQGAQRPGMGKDFYETCDCVREMFDRAEAVRPGTLGTMFEGDADMLRATENAQPSLYLCDLAAARALGEVGVTAAGVAGFSLGELPALAYAGAYDALDGFSLTVRRGALMGEATHEAKTGMVAVVKLDNATVEECCRAYRAVYPVNYNCPGQLAVAGDAAEIAEFSKDIAARGGRAVPLAVAGGFHSPFMDGAARKFADVLAGVDFRTPRIPVYANRTGAPYEEPVAKTLSEQMNHPVLWERTIRRMAEDGFDTFVETGVGNVLTKLIGKILPEARAFTVDSAEACARVAAEVGAHA